MVTVTSGRSAIDAPAVDTQSETTARSVLRGAQSERDWSPASRPRHPTTWLPSRPDVYEDVMSVAASINRAIRRPIDSVGYRTRFVVARRAYRRRWSREAEPGMPRVLVIESTVPHVRLGAGYPRSNLIVRELVRLGYKVTLYPLLNAVESKRRAYKDIPMDVELALNLGYPYVERFLEQRLHRYACVFVTRPHNMALVAPFLERLHYSHIVYDCEALASMRASRFRHLRGVPLDPDEVDALVRDELAVARRSQCISAVSDEERRYIERLCPQPVRTLGFACDAAPTPTAFAGRWGFLLVGALADSVDSPNTDAALWFIERVLPLIRQKLGDEVALRVVGQCDRRLRKRLGRDGVEFVGSVHDLTPEYDRARVFIAATRFAAGLPLKVYDAARHGVPVVATSLIAGQVGWWDGDGLLVADEPEDFAAACVRLHSALDEWERLRRGGIARVTADCSLTQFAEQLKEVIDQVLNVPECST